MVNMQLKVCVTAAGSLTSSHSPEALMDAQVDPRFGRCSYFIIVNTDSMAMEVLPNLSAQSAHGAGVQAAQTVANTGIEAVITGIIGPNAYQVLSAAGIKIVTGASGTVREVIEQYKSGRLQEGTGPSATPHFGIERGSGIGYKRGISLAERRMTFSNEGEVASSSPSLAGVSQFSDDSRSMTPQAFGKKGELAALEDYRRKLRGEIESIDARLKELRAAAQREDEEQPKK